MFGASTTLARFLDQTKAGARAAQWIGGVAGVLQLALALMATWGLVAYAVERRTSEFGVRLALGATPAAIVQLVMRPSLLLLAAGVVMGGLGGVVASRVLKVGILRPRAGHMDRDDSAGAHLRRGRGNGRMGAGAACRRDKHAAALRQNSARVT